MEAFKEWARQYVLSGEEPAQQEAATKAAKGKFYYTKQPGQIFLILVRNRELGRQQDHRWQLGGLHPTVDGQRPGWWRRHGRQSSR